MLIYYHVFQYFGKIVKILLHIVETGDIIYLRSEIVGQLERSDR